ncbi:NUDIX hydrolase YfcD [Salinicola rhizosphaerae]|uniref:Nudix hydrolase n=1 Tax=Salinicola rhizosphaerae TaxID=1443141 RepID=A0ABQ3E1N5_9GAMM|nr:NUDIX hydrolase YfcD [Salinicola rhizosphaerae]GHB22821.1 putative Nudix hydrolase [Salinicola rhizosphaerae]
MSSIVIADEQVQLVDARNRPCGSAARATMRRLGCWHRATYIVVRNARGEICVQERTLIKETHPGWFDLAAGGVVGAGEAWLPAARRELEEELGIRGVPLVPEGEFRFVEGTLRIFGALFSVTYEGALRLQPEEVAAVRWLSPAEALALQKATPDSRLALQSILQERH